MHLTPHLAQVQDQLTAAAALGDERTREIAASLGTAAAPAVRLAVLNALSAAADEITAALLDHPGSPAVSIRLDEDEVHVSVQTTAEPAPAPAEGRGDDGDASARISLRLSEALKSDIDRAAAATASRSTPGWSAPRRRPCSPTRSPPSVPLSAPSAGAGPSTAASAAGSTADPPAGNPPAIRRPTTTRTCQGDP